MICSLVAQASACGAQPSGLQALLPQVARHEPHKAGRTTIKTRSTFIAVSCGGSTTVRPRSRIRSPCLRMAEAHGTTALVATPHASPYRFEPGLVAERIAGLSAAVKSNGGALRFPTGCDFHLSDDHIQDAIQNPAKYTINQKNYLEESQHPTCPRVRHRRREPRCRPSSDAPRSQFLQAPARAANNWRSLTTSSSGQALSSISSSVPTPSSGWA